MLLTNRLNFFDKRGNELNLQPDPAVKVTVVDPSNSGGYGASFNVYTNRDGQIVTIEIISGGENYGPDTYIVCENVFTGHTYSITTLVIGEGGEILTLLIPNSPVDADNAGFPYPSVTWKGEIYFDIVSSGLVENQEIFVLEQVVSEAQTPPNLNIGHSFPRADEGEQLSAGYIQNTAPVNSPGSSPEYGTGAITVKQYSANGTIYAGKNTVYGIPDTSELAVGMIYAAVSGIPAGTTITEIVDQYTIKISQNATQNVVGVIASAYKPHGFANGMLIKVISSSQLAGTHLVTGVTDTQIFFQTPSSVPDILLAPSLADYYRAAPVWRGSVYGEEEEIFLFTVEYKEDYPVITKQTQIEVSPIDGTEASDGFSASQFGYMPSNDPNGSYPGYQYRVVSDNWEEKLMAFHLGFSAESEGSYLKLFVLEDITYNYAPALIAQISLRGEAEGQDERLGRLLQNFGRDVTEEQELIMRDSDVYEDLPNYRLLNTKRKEMLLQGDEIWPYLGAYRGLVNIVNWFGYYDLRIKEYWLNVKQGDPYEGKYKQIQIPFQLEERGFHGQSLGMVPSKVYRKTNKFGLFYDLNKESGVLDENGVPVTIDAFQFSNEEILIKLFALKEYLLQNFLPLNTQIVDIVGEGVYYERYAANSWNDRVEQFVVEATRPVDFMADETRVEIVDARPYDAAEKAYVYEPGVNTVKQFYTTYTVKSVSVSSSPSSPNFLKIPLVSLETASNTASPSQIWVGSCYVKTEEFFGDSIYPSSNGGINYSVGDIVTLGGGVYKSPIKIKVTGVSPEGTILTFSVFDTGSKYLSLPDSFSQSFVQSEDLTNNFYYSGVGTGLILSAENLSYVIEGVKTRTIGKGYPVNDTFSLKFYDATTGLAIIGVVYSLEKILVEGPYIGYFDEVTRPVALTNEPGIPVAAPVDLIAEGFDVTWDKMTFSWDNLWSASDAAIVAWADRLPYGSGIIIGLEIVSQGNNYSQVPTIQFAGGGGLNAAATAKLKNGKLQLLEVEVTSIVSTSPTSSTVYLATPFDVSPGVYIPYSVGAMVTGTDTAGNSIPKPAVITNLDLAGGTYFEIDYEFDSAAGNFNVYVHEGAVITNPGSGYIENPAVYTVGGHTSSMYTWDKIGQGNFYEMEWKVDSEFGTTPFSYTSGHGSIEALRNHRVLLPYKGFYRVELIVYDTDNNWVNEIKRNYIEVYMPEALPSMASRFIGPSYAPGQPHADGGTGSVSNMLQIEQNCVDTWDEAFYMWDEFWGRWINPIKTWTTWTDCDISWDTLEVTPNSEENHWNFPVVPQHEVYKVSAYDHLIGKCVSLTPVFISTATVIIELSEYTSSQKAPNISSGSPIFFRRGDSIFQTYAIASASYPGPNLIQFTITTAGLPQSLKDSPENWEVLREIAGTIIVKEDLYTADTGITLVPGQFIRVQGNSETPLNNTRDGYIANQTLWGIPIQSKIVDSGTVIGIDLEDYYQSNELKRPWTNGQIYQVRDGNDSLWFENSAPSVNVYLEELNTPTETSWGNVGMLYINTTPGSPNATSAAPLAEIIPGFSEIIIVIKNEDTGIIAYQQHLRVVDMFLNTSNEGSPWSLWSEAADPQIVCLQVVTIDGKPIADTLNKLGVVSSPSSSAWIEYKYNVFPTRISSASGAPDLSIYMDFNTRPAHPLFLEEPATNPTGWYYDHAISTGNFSLEVTNVGSYAPTAGWTIVSVKDPNHELYRCDSTFAQTATDFDEDYATTHLGTKLAWNEVENLSWSALCSQTWVTLDWNYNFYPNFRFSLTSPGNDYLQINESSPYYFLNTSTSYEEATIFAVDALNNNINREVYPTFYPNDGTGISNFSYDVYSNVPERIVSGVYTWGDPSTPSLFGDETGISTGSMVLANNVDPGWTVDSTASGEILLAPSSSTSSIPWIPACSIHVDTIAGSRKLTNIVGYLASLPQGGWLWDPSTQTIFGLFGPAVGQITESDGFVTSIIINSPAAETTSSLNLEVYPRRSGIVKFLNIGEAEDIAITASAKTPGTGSLGYVRSNGLAGFIANHDEQSSFTQIPYAYTFPLGNYYKWVQDPSIFYGGGLENSLLQFAQPYRNIQTFIGEGGERLYSPSGGGWYPGIAWGSSGYTDGAYQLFDVSQENLYKPIAKVAIYDIDGNPVLDPGNELFIVLNTWFDGSCVVYTTATTDVFNFTTSTNPQYDGAPLRVVLLDQTNQHQQSFDCVLAQSIYGILGRSSVFFIASYTADLNLDYDWTAYLLSSIDADKIANLYPGMHLGSSPDLIGDYQFTTKILEVHEDYIVINNPMPSTQIDEFVAYVPLDLSLNVQTVNSKIWSRTRQWDSMRLQYADSISSAFTWEDTTISVREKKVPAGSSVLFSSDASDIAGKAAFLWNLYMDGTKICSVTDKDFLWTFLEEGFYDIELKITDTNGNIQTKYYTNFIEVYIAEHQMA